VGVGDELGRQIDFFKVNPGTRRLEPAGSIDPADGLVPYGSCMYHSSVSGKHYYFVNAKSGVVQQWELRDGGSGAGQVVGDLVRSFTVGTQPEGCVADDFLGHVYVGEEAVGIWKFGAEPGAGAARTQVDHTGPDGHLVADVEGLAIYYAGADRGYLLASSQGNSTIAVYTREGGNAFVGSFRVEANGTIDGVTGTDGLEVTSFGMSGAFPNGLLAVHDNANDGGSASNIKYVLWDPIAGALGLLMDTSVDPRAVRPVQHLGVRE
jgi:3-phytase